LRGWQRKFASRVRQNLPSWSAPPADRGKRRIRDSAPGRRRHIERTPTGREDLQWPHICAFTPCHGKPTLPTPRNRRSTSRWETFYPWWLWRTATTTAGYKISSTTRWRSLPICTRFSGLFATIAPPHKLIADCERPLIYAIRIPALLRSHWQFTRTTTVHQSVLQSVSAAETAPSARG